MIETYFAMKCNPFNKGISNKDIYETVDFKEMQARQKYLLNTKGIGLFTGAPGLGKTISVKYFIDSLNKGMYKPVYLCLSTLTVMDFYKSLCIGLGIIPKYKKIDMFLQIQETIKSYVKDKKITPIILLDEAQYLRTDVLNDLKMLFNFEYDSNNMIVLMLIGQPILNNILSRNTHEALVQRIVVNYTFLGMDENEVRSYIVDRLKLSGINENIFDESAIKALYSNCTGSLRKLNVLVEKCFLICAQKKENIISNEVVMAAVNDINIV